MLALAKYGRTFRLPGRFGRPKLVPQSTFFATKKNTDNSNDWASASKEKTLVIVESPAKARTIQKFVDSDSFVIDFCAGHIRDLPTKTDQSPEYKNKIVCKDISLTASSLGIDVNDNFKPLYVNSADKADLIKRLKGLAKTATRIIFATDEDREGEAISWHLLEVLKPKVPYKRAVFHEITKEAILRAFEHPRDIDLNLVQSQEARRIIDRLAGFTISPLLWRYIAPGLSAGRVQSCGLHSITERERSRWKFVPSSYCSLTALLETTGTNNNVALVSKLHSVNTRKVATEKDFDSGTGDLRLSSSSGGSGEATRDGNSKLIVLNENITSQLMAWLNGTTTTSTPSAATAPPSFAITDVDTRRVSRRAPVPFITSTLQQEASRKHGFSPARTMALAQTLYEKGYITYMRTDSPTLSSTATKASEGMVKGLFGAEYLQSEKSDTSDSTTKSVEKSSKGAKSEPISPQSAPKNAQEAHEAIRPAEISGKFTLPSLLQNVSKEELVLYSLILRRTLASVMKSSTSVTNTYTITASSSSGGASSGKAKKTSKANTTTSTATTASTTSGDAESPSSAMAFEQAVFRSSDTQVVFAGYLAAIDMFKNSGEKSGSGGGGGGVVLKQGQTLRLSDRSDMHTLMVTTGSADPDAADAESVEPSASTNTNSNATSNTTSDTSYPGLHTSRHHTRPPTRFTEASFIAEMESLGVGRPSTYSAILKTLQDRNYIVVDKQSLIPTIQGMVVSEFLSKHFPSFVDAQFTAGMECSLDSIARGEGDKNKVLHRFYLHDEGEGSGDGGTSGNNGLLPTIVSKLRSSKKAGSSSSVDSASDTASGGIDGSTSRTLRISFLDSLGVIHSYGNGAVFEKYNTTSTISSDGTNSDVSGMNATLSGIKYTLPGAMQRDLRDVTFDNILQLITHEKPLGGDCIGYTYYTSHSSSSGSSSDDGKIGTHTAGLPIFQKSGKYGRYLQVGSAGDEVRYFSLPSSVLGDVGVEEALLYTSMPRVLGVHPALGKNVVVDVKYGNVVVGIENHAQRITIPATDYSHIGNITLALALQHLPEDATTLIAGGSLGTYNDQEVVVAHGKYGPYLRCGQTVCSLRGVDAANVTLQDAILMLQNKGSAIGSGGRGGGRGVKRGGGVGKSAAAKKVKATKVTKATKATKAKVVKTKKVSAAPTVSGGDGDGDVDVDGATKKVTVKKTAAKKAVTKKVAAKKSTAAAAKKKALSNSVVSAVVKKVRARKSTSGDVDSGAAAGDGGGGAGGGSVEGESTGEKKKAVRKTKTKVE